MLLTSKPMATMANNFENVTVVGCGTIGLPCAVAFATRGACVTGVDIDIERVQRLSEGRVDRLDDGLGPALASALADKRIAFSQSFAPSASPTAFIIAVQTPVDPEGNPIWRFFRSAVDAVLACARPDDLVVLRTTVPVGTTRKLADEIRGRGLKLLVAACPDRSITGNSFREQFTAPTIVGGVDAESTRAAAGLFARLGPLVEVASPETAEAIKLFCNVQRDIAFAAANQFALICEGLDLDFEDIRRAATHMYPRFSLARPGPVGGDCLSKDSFLLAAAVDDPVASLPLVFSARRLNLSLIDFVTTAVCAHLEKTAPRQPVVAVLGTAFKGEPATTDERHSFGIALAEAIKRRLQDAEVRTWDPARASGGNDETPDGAARAADVVVLANDHPALGRLDLDRIAALLRRGGLIYDVCGRTLTGSKRLPNDVVFHSFGRRLDAVDSV